MSSKDNKDTLSTVSTLSDFNSTTILTEKLENGKDGDDYNPFEHRDQTHSNSTTGALAHLLKSSLGTGILAMPMAFKNAGLLFGVVGTLTVGFICTYCIHILVDTSHQVCRKAKVPSLDFAGTAEKVFEHGPKALRKYANFARIFCEYGMCATYLGVISLFIVLIATSFGEVINAELKVDWDIRLYIAMTLLPCIILGEIRQLKYLVPFSAMANMCIIVVFGITFYYMLSLPLITHDKPLFAGWHSLPLFFNTVIFAMEGIGTVMPIENSMRKPQQFLGCPGVLNTAMIVVVLLYTLIGFLGYISFGAGVSAIVTNGLPTGELLAEIAQVLIAIATLFTFGLQFYVPMDIIWRKVAPRISKDKHNISQICLRAGIIMIMGGIAAAIPNLNAFIGLIGAIFLSILGLFVPAVVETVFRYPDFGVGNWILIKNICLMVTAILALITGSYVSIHEIIAIYK